MGALKRLFLAVAVDRQVRSMLAQHLNAWTLPGKVVPPDNWHLTVRFLGSIAETCREVLTARIDETDLGKSFALTVREMGAFPRGSRASVLWLGISDEEQGLVRLNSLTEQASRQSGIAPQERPFSAHLTLSRLRPPENVAELIGSYHPQPFRWTVNELTLFESKPGPVYIEVDRFQLRRPHPSSRR